MIQDKIFYTSCFGFLLGVLLRSFIFVNFYFNIFLILISISILLMYFFSSRNSLLIIPVIFVLAFSVGILRFSMADYDLLRREAVLADSLNKYIKIRGEIIDEPELKEKSQRLIIQTNLEGQKIKILLNVPSTDSYSYGEVIDIYGKLEKPENFLTDQGKNFDYINYLRKDGVFYKIGDYPTIEKTGVNEGNFIKKNLFDFKNNFLAKLNNVITYPENALLAGIILGEKSSFSTDLREDFIRTGTIHIVALSGYNVTIVAEWIMKVFSFIPAILRISNAENFGFGLGILSILLFVIMTGSSSTALRAGIMASLALISRGSGRNYDVGRILVLTGVAMILFNPLILVFDVSFQLSFISTVAVIFISPRVQKYFLFITDKFGLRDIVSVTFSAYLFVLPFILYKMGNLSVTALPVNFLVLPFIPFTMLLGFLTGSIGMFSHIISIPFGFITYLFLHYEIWVIEFFSHFSFSVFVIPDFPIVLVILFYAYFVRKIFFNL